MSVCSRAGWGWGVTWHPLGPVQTCSFGELSLPIGKWEVGFRLKGLLFYFVFQKFVAQGECELKQQIKRLQEYRVNGITTHRGAIVYEKLKKGREENKKKGTVLSDVLAHVQVQHC